jgi:hypothetical protein
MIPARVMSRVRVVSPRVSSSFFNFLKQIQYLLLTAWPSSKCTANFSHFKTYAGASCTGSRYYHENWDVTMKSYRRNTKETLSTMIGNHHSCKWCDIDNMCHSYNEKQPPASLCKIDDYIEYQSTCPLEPAYPTEPPEFLGDWMSALLQISSFSSTPLSELSLPGTHDSLSYDLSLTLAKDGVDDRDRLSKILRELSILRPNELEEVIRLQAQSQKLDIYQQLNNGIRFIDFRITYESKEIEGNKPDWYSLHSLLSNHPAYVYLEAIREWMEQHSEEVVVIWFSRHGSVSDRSESAYPQTPVSAKRFFWRFVEDLFDGVMIDKTISDYRTTGIQDLVARNHRMIPFVSDYEEFTGSSVHGYDSRCIKNSFKGRVFDEVNTYHAQREYFFSHGDVNEEQWFDLLGMNSAVEEWQVESALKKRFIPFNIFDICASSVNIPGNLMCPTSLLDVEQLQNYYNQHILAEAYDAFASGAVKDVHFPNAFYLDGLDFDGSLRTGTMTLEGRSHPDASKDYSQKKYAFVDTIIAYNLEKVCKVPLEFLDVAACQALQTCVEERIARYPALRWQEPAFGRRDDWPL